MGHGEENWEKVCWDVGGVLIKILKKKKKKKSEEKNLGRNYKTSRPTDGMPNEYSF